MHTSIKIISVLSLSLLSACASIVEGRSQQIFINSDPQGAECKLIRKGQILGRVTTPGSILIEKTKDDMTTECNKAGYYPNSEPNTSGVAGATLGNILAGGLVGWAVDSASGADNQYDGNVFVTLDKKP